MNQLPCICIQFALLLCSTTTLFGTLSGTKANTKQTFITAQIHVLESAKKTAVCCALNSLLIFSKLLLICPFKRSAGIAS